MNKISLLFTCIILLIIFSGSGKKPVFSVRETETGMELSENGKKVFSYRKTPKASGKFFYNNYLHPVYNLKGEIITEEFPADHLNHRGIFWSWHQLYINDTSIGDGWMLDNIVQDVTDLEYDVSRKRASFRIRVLWRSSIWQNGKAFVEEKTSVIVHRLQGNVRKIDFLIRLNPLVEGVQIGGSDDEKGYGGFCVRIKMPESLVFMSENGKVTPQNLQIKSGPWMDFSAIFGESGTPGGLAVLCHPSVPNYPAPWILRQRGSMQNIVWPGRERIKLSSPLTLKYRIIIHDGDSRSIDLVKMQEEYNRTKGF